MQCKYTPDFCIPITSGRWLVSQLKIDRNENSALPQKPINSLDSENECHKTVQAIRQMNTTLYCDNLDVTCLFCKRYNLIAMVSSGERTHDEVTKRERSNWQLCIFENSSTMISGLSFGWSSWKEFHQVARITTAFILLLSLRCSPSCRQSCSMSLSRLFSVECFRCSRLVKNFSSIEPIENSALRFVHSTFSYMWSLTQFSLRHLISFQDKTRI